jgi:hypothetical protein
MFRLLGAFTLLAATAGCASFSETFLVQRARTGHQDGQDAAAILYRPGTALTGRGLQLQIPWVDIHGCGAEGMRFEWTGPSTKYLWSVVTKPSQGTIAIFEHDAIYSLLGADEEGRGVASSEAKSECLITLRDDAPVGVRAAVGASRDRAERLLKTLVAERLPSLAASAWTEQYDYDASTRSLNLLPGMRLKVTHEAPFTTDAGRDTESAHVGLLAAPIYLQLQSGGASDSGRGTWTPTVTRLGFNRDNTLVATEDGWYSATGLHELAGKPRYWRLYVPKTLESPQLLTDIEEGARLGFVGRVTQLQRSNSGWIVRVRVPSRMREVIAGDRSIKLNGEQAQVGRTVDSVDGVEVDLRIPPAAADGLALAQLREGSFVNIVAAPQPARAGGAIGLQPKSNVARGDLNVHEVFPSKKDGYPGFVLAAANERQDLFSFHQDVRRGDLTSACKNLTSDSKGGCYVLRFRAIHVPEIPVTIQGEQVWVEVGTTVRDVLYARAGRRLRDYAGLAASPSGRDLAHALQDEVLLEALRSAQLTRPFGAGRAAIMARTPGDHRSVLGITLQIGDQIKWQR